jgi:PAS domain S-box-containing protein
LAMNRAGDKAMAESRAAWLTGGGEMGKLIRVMDWSRTPVGPIESWPQSLKTAVNILLNSRYPMFVWWGRELTNIYNDAHMSMLGARHPQALGRSAPNVWADVWPVVGPQAEVVMREGRATWNESILLVMERHGYTEEAYFTFSYSPAPDDAGGVGGVFCAVTEDTARVLDERRLKTLRDLGERSLAGAKTVGQACRAAAVTLADNLHDFPFALIYLLDEDGKRARLCESGNLPAGTKASPATVVIGSGDDVWNFSRVVETSKSQIVEDLEKRFGRLPAGPWVDDWTKRALALPLARAGAQELPAGFLVAGTSPRLAFNEDYRSFLDLAAGQIASAISNARAYEEERKRAEALAEIDRAKTAFFSNVSHEFRTPLTLLLGPLEDALAADGLSAEAREQLKLARRNSLRLLKLVNMLLDFSRIEAGRIQAVYEPAADLAERNRAEEAVSQLAAIVESSEDAIVSKDLNGVIMSWNKGAEMLFGYAAEEVIGKSVMILIPPDRADEETRVLERVRRGEKIDRYETVGRRKDGALVEISLMVAPLRDEAGNVVGASKIARDITERKRVERALAEGERQQRALYQLADHLHRARSLDDVYDAALDAILDALRCDRASILLFDDAGVMRFVGWRGLSDAYRKVVEGHSPWRPDEKYPEPVYINEVDMAEIDDSLKAVVKAEGIGALAFIPLVSRGKLIGKFMTYFNAPHVFSDDELALSLTIARQLAFGIDRKRAEELLRQNAAQLTLITNTAPVFIAHCDAQARFKFVNKPYAERLGLAPENCIGKRLPEVVGAEAYEILRQHIEVALSGEPVEFEVEVPYAPIGRRFIHSSYAPEFDADGKVVGFVAAITDITERKKAEQKLIAATAKFESVFNQSGIYAGMMDLQGYLREVNDLAVNRCGYTREQVLDRPFWETPWWRGSEGVKARIRAATEQAAAGMVFREELPYWWADGTEHVAEFAIHPIRDQDGGVMLLYPTSIDITERKRAEEAIARLLAEEQAAREVAEQATRAKDEFLALVSHELRSPLNAILGWNRLLRSQRGDDPQIAKLAETVERSGKAQLQLIEDLLDTARIITGKMKLEFQPVEPVAVISAALDTVRPAADSKGVAITTDLDPKAGQVTGDPDRLQQVVWNLLSNAIKFTPSGGRVRVELRRGGEGVRIVVADTGQGISPDLLPYVFDRFKQGDLDASRRYGGLGLGLALVKHLVELHGGSVAVESPGAGQGATFIVNLPVRAVRGDSVTESRREGETTVDRRAGRRTRTARLEGVRALVVDDDVGARELLAATLEQYGVLVTGADSTAAALAALESRFGDEASEPFDILISDIGMPGADGYELIRRVRAHADGRVSRIRAIALTAYARTEDRMRALRAGFQMHVPKPVDEEELTTVIAALTDRM